MDVETRMDVEALIDTYVLDVAQLLPRKQRHDVALELRALLREELQARAAACGRTLDAEIALEGLRDFGRPGDVAARYFEPFVIVPAADTRRFTFAAIVGAAVLVGLSALGGWSGSSATPGTPATSDELGFAILAWLGVLVSYFGLVGVARRWFGYAARSWVPRDRDGVNRAGSVAVVALICLGIVAYGAPSWLFALFTHGRTLSAWLDYDPGFRGSRLPVLFVLWGLQAVLFALLAVRGRWSLVLRRVSLGLEAAVALVLVWFLVAGSVFVETAANKAALGAIYAFAFLLFVDVGVKLYWGVRRMPPTDGFRPPVIQSF